MNACEALIEAGGLAPSGDNTQPWRISGDSQTGSIRVAVDPARDQSPMNAGQRMARIAVGAAVENILRTAQYNQLAPRLRLVGTAGDCEIELDRPPTGPLEIEQALRDRVSNRRIYDGGSLSCDQMSALKEVGLEAGPVRIEWIFDDDVKHALTELIAQGDALLFHIDAMRRAFFENVRFDATPEAEVEEGLSLGSLELNRADRTAFRLLRHFPGWLFRAARISKQFAVKTRALAASASGFCCVIASDDAPTTDVHVGRGMQRSWLELTKKRLAAQPMMSLPVLANAQLYGACQTELGQLPPLLEKLSRLISTSQSGRVAAILRFGFAQPPSGRTGRRPLS